MCSVGFREHGFRINLVLKVLCHTDELRRIHRLGGSEKHRLFFSHGIRANMVCGLRDHRGVLIAKLASDERLLRPRKVFQLAADDDMLGSRAAAQVATRAEPRDQVDGALCGVFAGLVEASEIGGKTALRRLPASCQVIRPWPSSSPTVRPSVSPYASIASIKAFPARSRSWPDDGMVAS